jgi:hypothetical protein
MDKKCLDSLLCGFTGFPAAFEKFKNLLHRRPMTVGDEVDLYASPVRLDARAQVFRVRGALIR